MYSSPWKLVLLIVLLPGSMFAQSHQEKLDALRKEYEAATEKWNARFNLPEDQIDFVVRYRDWPAWEYAPRFVALGEAAGAEKAGFQALVEVVNLGNAVSGSDRELLPHHSRALELLRAHHFDNDLRPICSTLANSLTPKSEEFLRDVIQNGRTREERAEACFSLGRLLASKRLVSQPQSWFHQPPQTDVAKYIAERCRPALAAYLEGSDENALADEAVALFTRVTEEFADLTMLRGNRLLGEAAQGELFELKHLVPGQAVPNIIGKDLAGQPMELQEFRGSVVLLVFWASWCGPCMGAIPHEKELVRRFAGRPFALVGVNGDGSLEAANRTVQEHEIPWRSFWNGEAGPQGNISSSWNVKGWPTVYVIDHEGIIRYKQLHREALDEPLEKLVTLAEERR